MTLKPAQIYMKLKPQHLGKQAQNVETRVKGKKKHKHTKNYNMSRKCLRAEQTEKNKQGTFDFVHKSDNFTLIFQICAI